jgi:hypothetical protein
MTITCPNRLFWRSTDWFRASKLSMSSKFYTVLYTVQGHVKGGGNFFNNFIPQRLLSRDIHTSALKFEHPPDRILL